MVKSIFKPTKKKVIFIVILVIVVLGVSQFIRIKGQAANQNAKPQYQTYNLVKQDLKKEVSVNGTVESVTKKQVESDLTNLKITKLNVKVGDIVKAGDILCTLDSSSIDQKLQSANQSNQISNKKLKDALGDAQTNYQDAITTRDVGKARNAQAVTDATTAYQQAVSDRDSANTAYQQAQAVTQDALNKYNALQQTSTQSSGSDTTEQVAASQTALTQAQTAYESAQADEKDKKAALDSAQDKVTTALATLNTQKQTQQDQDQANDKNVTLQKSALDSAQLDINASTSGDGAQTVDDLNQQKAKCSITAPCDGTITELGVEEGDVYTGGTIATVQDTNACRISATVDQYSISELTTGLPAIIKTDATENEEIQGVLSFVSPVPSSSTDSTGKVTVTTDYPIHVDLTQQNSKLRLGMNAKTSIILAEAKSVYAVPSECIMSVNGQDQITILLDEKTGKTKTIQVTKGLETDYYVQISSDELKDNMKVIIPDDTQSVESATEADTQAADASSSLD